MKRFLFSVLAVLAAQSLFSQQDPFNKAKAALTLHDTTAALVSFQDALKQGLKSGESNFYIGTINFGRQNYADAIRYLQASLKFNDENIDALLTLGDSYIALNDVQSAMTQYRRAVKLAPKNGTAFLAYGKALLMADSTDQAIIYLTRSIEFDPTNPTIYVALGDAYFKQNVVVLAVTQYRKAIDLDPKNIGLRYRLARALVKNRQYNDAVKEYEEIVGFDSTASDAYLEEGSILVRASQFKRAVSPLKKYTALRPNSTEGWSWFAKALQGSEEFADAALSAEKSLKLDSTSVDMWRVRAYSLIETKDCQGSLAAFARLERMKSTKPEDLAPQGRAYALCKQPEKAQSVLESALKVDSANCELYVPLASIYMTKQDYERAAYYFEKKVACDPKSAKALTSYVNAAICYFQRKDYARTRDLLFRSVEIWPEFLTARFWIGRYYTAVDSLDKAKETYDEVLRIIGTNTDKFGSQAAEAHAMIGMYFFTTQKYERAVESLKKSLALQGDGPGTSERRISLGQATLQTLDPKGSPEDNSRRVDESAKLFRKAIEQDPNNAQAHLWLGQCLVLMRKEGDNEGNKRLQEEACGEYRKVLKIEPKNTDAKKGMERIGCQGTGK